jgi:hypothetical protein
MSIFEYRANIVAKLPLAWADLLLRWLGGWG